MFVPPAGASKTNSTAGADVCARPASQPSPINPITIPAWTIKLRHKAAAGRYLEFRRDDCVCGRPVDGRTYRATRKLELAAWAETFFRGTEKVFGCAEFEDDARAALARLVGDDGVRAKHPIAIDLLKRVLSVDLDDPANRKADVPRALGLVRRGAKGIRTCESSVLLNFESRGRLHVRGHVSADSAIRGPAFWTRHKRFIGDGHLAAARRSRCTCLPRG
jgi:hypothetical protein